MTVKYVFIGADGDIPGHQFTTFGQMAEIDQPVAEMHIANDFPLLPADKFEALPVENRKFQAGLALHAFRESLRNPVEVPQAAPAEVIEHVGSE